MKGLVTLAYKMAQFYGKINSNKWIGGFAHRSKVNLSRFEFNMGKLGYTNLHP